MRDIIPGGESPPALDVRERGCPLFFHRWARLGEPTEKGATLTTQQSVIVRACARAGAMGAEEVAPGARTLHDIGRDVGGGGWKLLVETSRIHSDFLL
jgi:hypothetical protein